MAFLGPDGSRTKRGAECARGIGLIRAIERRRAMEVIEPVATRIVRRQLRNADGPFEKPVCWCTMETTEKIVESYCRYIKQWFTIPNIRCEGQYEVDLLAVDTTLPKKLRRYHIECGVSISGSYSKLTAKPFSTEQLRIRVQQAGQRRTIGFFIQRKFKQAHVLAEIRKYGFMPGNYRRIIVTWGATDEAEVAAKENGIQLWDFRDLLQEIAEAHRDHKTYFTDDTARTIQLFAMAATRRKSASGEP